MHITRKLAAAVAGVAVAGLAFGLAPAAQADPWSTTTSSYTQNRPVNGTGSDTTQDVVNALAAVVRNADDELILGSWDATIPAGQGAFLTTHTGGTSIPRPNGSSQGIAALKAAVAGATLTNARGTSSGALDTTDLQFARSSSLPGAAVSNGVYSHIPLAVDAVAYAVNEDNTSVSRSLTKADLTAIYSASAGATVSLSVGNRVVGTQSTPGAQIVPLLPQTGSGTRSFWLGQLGLTEATVGSAVAWTYTDGTGAHDVQEHDGSALVVPNSIVPFSIAQFIAQTKVSLNASAFSVYPGVTVTNRLHGAELGNVDNKAAVVSGKLNTASTFVRPVFNVVPFAAISGDLKAAFVDDPTTTASTTDGLVYKQTRPGNSALLVIEDLGFGSLGTGTNIGGTNWVPGDTSKRTN